MMFDNECNVRSYNGRFSDPVRNWTNGGECPQKAGKAVTIGRQDRRALRTRRALHEALIALTLRKGYEALTIQEIIDEADVGRSTFYAHFTGKDDLLRSGFEAFRRQFAEQHPPAKAAPGKHEPDLAAVGLALFEHAIQYCDVYKALVGGRGGMLADTEFRRIVEEFLGHAGGDADDLPGPLRTRFAVDTFISVLTWAFAQKPLPAPETLDVIYLRLLHSGLGPERGHEA